MSKHRKIEIGGNNKGKNVIHEKMHLRSEEMSQNDEHACIMRETIFINSDNLSDEQIFENVKVKVEPLYIGSNDNELSQNNSEKDDVETIDNNKMKRRKKKLHGSFKRKNLNRKGGTKLTNLVESTENSTVAIDAARNNPSLDLYKKVVNEYGDEVKVKVEESVVERRRRLTRERMRRKRMKMTEKERQIAIRKQRIRTQKLRLKQRLEETEEQAEIRRKKCNEQRRRSRQKMRQISESLLEQNSRRYLSSIVSENDDAGFAEISDLVKTTLSKRQREGSYKLVDGRDDETEDEKEIRLLKYKLETKMHRQRLKKIKELGDNWEADLNVDLTLSDDKVDEQNIQKKTFKNKKRAADDIEYLYFYENSGERRKRLDREKYKAKYLARKQMQREILDINEECDKVMSRRCLDLDD